MDTSSSTDAEERSRDDDSLGGQTKVEAGSFRDKMRRRLGPAWRVLVFVAGLVCIAIGIALIVLPGPLTIPPVIVGLWIWSTEFEWAHRFFEVWKKKGQEAWGHAKRHPVSSSVITVGGLVGGGVLIWATLHYDLFARAKDLVGL